MKQREFEKCVGCNRGVAAAGVHFYRVEVEQFILNPRAIERQHGLEQMLGSAALAAAMGPDEDIAASVDKSRVLICADCSLSMPVAILLSREAG